MAITRRNRNVKPQKSTPRTIRVPPGFANAGMKVNTDTVGLVANEVRNITTLTGNTKQDILTSTFQDLGFTTPQNFGDRIVDISAAEFIRSREVSFSAKAFMPGGRLYAFFDGVDVSADCKPSGGAYGDPLICDSRGRLEGTFLIPNKEGKRFKTGGRIFRLTTSPTNQIYPPPASFGDTKYTATGWVDTKQTTTYSTRIHNVATTLSSVEGTLAPLSSSTTEFTNPCPRDPIAQSFFVYEDGGCFITDIDVFFYKKPSNPNNPQSPIILQVRPLDDGGTPSVRVLPFGEVIKEAYEVVTNEINLINGTLTVKGNDVDGEAGYDAGPWTSSSPITNVSGRTINDGEAIGLGTVPADDMIPTRFTFKSPIYLSKNNSYCFVLLSDSNEYNVWIAQSGPDVTGREGVDAFRDEGESNQNIGTTENISKDPYIQGIFFKSQNAISWSQDQTIDLKFKIWKAQFETAVNGEIDFVNEELPLATLTLDPFETKNGSGLIRVIHPSHGMAVTSPATKVVFSPAYDTVLTGTLTSSGTTVTGVGTAFNTELVVGSFIEHPITRECRKVTAIGSATSLTIASAFTATYDLATQDGVFATSFVVPSGSDLGGFDASTIYRFTGFNIVSAEMDHYVIDVGSNATITGKFGGPYVQATENKRFEELLFLTTPLVLPGTNVAWNVETTTSKGINDPVNTAYDVPPPVNLSANAPFAFDVPCQVSSWINERNPSDAPNPGPSGVVTSGLGDKKSLKIKAVLSSTNPNVSPVVDISRFSVALKDNRIDNPTGTVAGTDVPASTIVNTTLDEFVCIPSTTTPLTGASYLTLTGTASSSGTTVTGSGTTFQSQLVVGDAIKADGEVRVVTAIANNTSLTINAAFTSPLAGDTVEKSSLYFSTSTGALSGTVALSGTTVTGTNTKFLSELSKGDLIKEISTGEERLVVSIASDTSLTVDVAFTTNPGPVSLITEPPPLSIKTANPSVALHLAKLDIGKLVSVSGSRTIADSYVLEVNYTPNNTIADSVLLGRPCLCEIVLDARPLTAAGFEFGAVTITQKDRYIDEIAPSGGSCSSKYVSKKLVVQNISNALKVVVDVNRDSSNQVDLYYKLDLAEDPRNLDDVNWTLAEWNLDIGGQIVPATPLPNDGPDDFSSYECTLSDLPGFLGAQIKIVFRGGNPARVPRIKNLTVLALDE